MPVAAPWRRLAYGQNTFVAIAGNNINTAGTAGSIAASSTDGITWTRRTLPVSVLWQSVSYLAGQFTAIAGGLTATSVAAYSLDGITWTRFNLSASSLWKDITGGGQSFVAIAGGSGGGATSFVSTSNTIYSTEEDVIFGVWEAPL
jgi:hypothetical protein